MQPIQARGCPDALHNLCRMELARHREEELGGPLGHLTELGVPEQMLNFSGSPQGRVDNIVLQAATKTSTATGHQCYQKCMADSRSGLSPGVPTVRS